LRLGILLASAASLQLAAGLAIQLAVLRIVGPGLETDAYIAAQTAPMVLFAVLAASLQNVWQPRLSVAHDQAEAWRIEQRAAQGQGLLLFGVATLVLAATVPAWSRLLFPAFSARQLELLAAMTPPLLAAALFNCLCLLQAAALRARERFLLAEAVGLGATLLALGLVVVLVPRQGIASVAWITLGRFVVVYGVLLGFTGWSRPSVVSGWRDAGAWRQLRPIVGSSSLHKAGPLVDRYWSSQSAPGGMTLFGLAQMGVVAVTTIIERALAMPVNARMGRLHAEGRHRAMRDALRRALLLIGVAVLVLFAVLLALRPGWDSLTATALKLEPPASQALWWYSVLLLGHVLSGAAGTVCVAVFYALGDARTPSIIISIGFLIGVAMKSLGFISFDLSGLAIATSAYQVLNLAALLLAVERRFRQLLAEPPSSGP
jgi:putative peptidoglycan lipid II flippase